jgi:hypothetical protein
MSTTNEALVVIHLEDESAHLSRKVCSDGACEPHAVPRLSSYQKRETPTVGHISLLFHSWTGMSAGAMPQGAPDAIAPVLSMICRNRRNDESENRNPLLRQFVLATLFCDIPRRNKVADSAPHAIQGQSTGRGDPLWRDLTLFESGKDPHA